VTEASTDTPELVRFVRTEFLHGEERTHLDETTPLLESGILDSLRIAVLLSYIRNDLGVQVPLAAMDATNFRDIRTIAELLEQQASEQEAGQTA
jgi:acyl carrier protein